MNFFTLKRVAVPLAGFLVAASLNVQAQGYEPIIESFRLGENDQLVIDRGGPVDRAGDVNGDNNEDLLIATGVGAVRVVYGPTEGFNGVLNGQQLDGVSGFIIQNDAQNNSLVAGIGDVNGDGLDDIAVASNTGTRVIFGSTTRVSRIFDVASLNGDNGFVFSSAATDVKRAGDINGDGLADIIVGNSSASPNGLMGAGVSYVIFGSRSGFPARLSPVQLDGTNGFSVIGQSAEDRTGRYVSGAGDFNNDGFGDFLIGAPNQTANNMAEAGKAYLVLGAANFPAVISLADIDGNNGFAFAGTDIQNMTGASVAAIGDLNHDGIDDIAIGAPGKGPFGVPSDYPGSAYVLFGGNFSGSAVLSESNLNGSNGLVLRGIRGGTIPIQAGEAIWGDMAGVDIDAAGDINGDGINDVMIGASHTIITASRKGVGQTYFLFGSTSAYPAALSLADLDASNGFRINGTGTTDYYGVSVAGAGDFNDDDRADVVIGASGQGESYVFYGRDTGLVSVGDAPSGAAGNASSGFPASVLSLGVDAQLLAFNERRDPTGPDPLPEGTPTDPLNPATPGYTAPNPVNTQDPARPGDDIPVDNIDNDANPGTPIGETGPDSGSSQENPVDIIDDPSDNLVRTSAGAMFWMLIVLLVAGSVRACRFNNFLKAIRHRA